MENIEITIAQSIETIAIDNGVSTDLIQVSTGELIEIKEGGVQGIQGPQGSAGPAGEAGPAGSDGIIGSNGADSTVPGPQGEVGPQGEQGIQGNSGAASKVPGPKGDAGSQGIQGIQGETGADSTVQGPQGVKGDAGADGVKGDDGADSTVQGPKGDDGGQGIQGIQGPAGNDSTVAGPQGIQGLQGDNGTDGADSIVPGPQGIQGPSGNDGAAGTQGQKGDTGDTGPKGDTGEDGVDGGSAYSFNKITGTGTQAITSTLSPIVFDQSVDSFGTDVVYSAGTPNRLTVQTTGVYKWGALVTDFSGAQRAQTACKLLVNGVETGLIRGSSYIRNTVTTWDYWAIEISSTPISLSAGDYVELAVGGVSSASYTFGGTVLHNCHKDKSEFWLERMA